MSEDFITIEESTRLERITKVEYYSRSGILYLVQEAENIDRKKVDPEKPFYTKYYASSVSKLDAECFNKGSTYELNEIRKEAPGISFIIDYVKIEPKKPFIVDITVAWVGRGYSKDGKYVTVL